MSQSTKSTRRLPADDQLDSEVVQFRAQFDEKSPLDEIVRAGAQSMLQAAIEAEVQEHIERFASKVDPRGNRQVVRNGRLPARKVMTGAGQLEIEQPRVRDNDPEKANRVVFSPSLIPQYMRRSPAMEELIPVLYLLGVSTGDYQQALAALVGEHAKGLSPNVVVRLKEQWTAEYEQWCKRRLDNTRYVYIWADGIHVKVRLKDQENKKQCILVVMGATADGHKELLAVQDGYRESEQSWSELLLDLKQRGLTLAPKLAIGDGALGFWAALRKVFAETREQRCWVHKTAAQQAAEECAGPSQAAPARDLDGRDPRRGRAGLRLLPRRLRRQVRCGRCVSGQGSRGAARLLRLPGRALEASAHHQSRREHLRNSALAHDQNQRLLVA